MSEKILEKIYDELMVIDSTLDISWGSAFMGSSGIQLYILTIKCKNIDIGFIRDYHITISYRLSGDYIEFNSIDSMLAHVKQILENKNEI